MKKKFLLSLALVLLLAAVGCTCGAQAVPDQPEQPAAADAPAAGTPAETAIPVQLPEVETLDAGAGSMVDGSGD